MVIVGDPEQRKVYWVGNRSEVVTSATVVPPGTKVKTKWLLNAFDLGTKRMMIFECNQQTFRALVSVRERFPFDKWAIEVKRNGAAGDTNTTYAVLPDKELTPEQKAYIAKQDTHDLTVFSGATTHLSVPSNGNGTSIEEAVRNEFQDDEIPF
jgi:hypothetical protein